MGGSGIDFEKPGGCPGDDWVLLIGSPGFAQKTADGREPHRLREATVQPGAPKEKRLLGESVAHGLFEGVDGLG